MELHHLRYFIALAEAGSLHQAARRLRLQQPALSQSIRALEADVGTRLVDRSPTGTQLTLAGKVFLTEVRNILSSLDRAVQIARQTGVGEDVPLRLGITRDVVTSQLATVLFSFRHASSHSQTVVRDAPAPYHQWMLVNNLLDLVLLPEAVAVGLGHTESLWKEDVHLALPASHPLAMSSAIDLHRLAGIPLITGFGDDVSGADHALLNACRSVGVDIVSTAQTSFLETRLMLVAAGFGVTALSAFSPIPATAPNIVGRPFSPPLNMVAPALAGSPSGRRA